MSTSNTKKRNQPMKKEPLFELKTAENNLYDIQPRSLHLDVIYYIPGLRSLIKEQRLSQL